MTPPPTGGLLALVIVCAGVAVVCLAGPIPCPWLAAVALVGGVVALALVIGATSPQD